MREEKTTYAYKLKYQEDLSFDKIMSFTRNLINDLPQQLVDDMYEKLKRGVVQIDTEPQMLVYLYSFGKMHKAKLDCAFAHLPKDFLQQPEINIIDYGCGQAIGTMCYVDFLKEEGIIQNIRKVTLIEPSETCLKRAALHTSVFLPEAEITTVNKTFDKLLMTDIETNENIPTLHILSNVLDLKFNLDRFALVITEHIKGYNQFVCVGPYFSYSNKDERISKFCSLIHGKENFSKVYEKYELDADKPWTANIKLFSIGELEENLSTEATEEDIKNGIEDEFGVVYSKDGKRLLICKDQESGTYVIKKGTKVICNNAFSQKYNFYGFDYIIIPDSVTSIGERAFPYCSSLKQINIPDSVTSIGERAFNGCKNLTIKSNSTRFIVDKGLLIDVQRKRIISYFGIDKKINIPDSVTSIGEWAFQCCSSLQQINIPDSVTSIGDGAFDECSSLQQIFIPDSVTSIGERAFWECRSLKQINIPNSVTSIGKLAFCMCSSLEQINIPDSVTSIGEDAFLGCSSLEQIYIPDSVTSIGREAFYKCSYLKQINIPDSVTSIGHGAFNGCKNLTIKSNSTRFIVDKGLLIDVQRKTIISY
ncbi:MAG: leucine-rich repeat domain-containing protein, partial [Paludibacteraceae bacterium]|nr:leucine-rich repeat domain-containing protein [Paludibacteraceae bacterium]